MSETSPPVPSVAPPAGDLVNILSETSSLGPVAPSPAASTEITLQVGGRPFITTATTLTHESGYFSSLLSGRWSFPQADRLYFIDADADLFVHILRYLRRGVLPVFYNESRGHDHALYLALLEEARYFDIPRLQKWLHDKTYLQAVKIEYSAEELLDNQLVSEVTGADVQVKSKAAWKTKQVYICPRGIFRHRDNPRACGRACEKIRGDAGWEYVDEQYLKTFAIRKRTFFDQEICLEGR